MKDTFHIVFVVLFFSGILAAFFATHEERDITRSHHEKLEACMAPEADIVRTAELIALNTMDIHSDAVVSKGLELEGSGHLNARHCTDWTKRLARSLGYSYGKREWNGWLQTSGKPLPQEAAPIEEIMKIRPGWMVEFWNGNGYNGRHAAIVTEIIDVHDDGSMKIDTISFSGNRAEGVTQKTYTLVGRDSIWDHESDERLVPVIATYPLMR